MAKGSCRCTADLMPFKYQTLILLYFLVFFGEQKGDWTPILHTIIFMWCIGYVNDYRSHLRKYSPLCLLHVLSPASHVAFMRMGVSKTSKTLIARQRRGFNPDTSALHGRAAAEGFPQLPGAHPKRTIELSQKK